MRLWIAAQKTVRSIDRSSERLIESDLVAFSPLQPPPSIPDARPTDNITEARNGTISGEGLVTLEINESPPTPVPENSSPFASFLAFLGLGAVHLWRKSRKGNK